jgi:hypothetical protein
VGFAEGLEEGGSVGDKEGLAVGEAEGDDVGLPVGLDVGFNDGEEVGFEEGLAVGVTEGESVGEGVGTEVGASVGAIDTDGAFVLRAQENVPASRSTQLSKIPSATSPVTILITFHPACGSATAVISLVSPSASMSGYRLVRLPLPAKVFPT